MGDGFLKGEFLVISVNDAEDIFHPRPQNQKKKIITWGSSTIKQFKLTKDAMFSHLQLNVECKHCWYGYWDSI